MSEQPVRRDSDKEELARAAELSRQPRFEPGQTFNSLLRWRWRTETTGVPAYEPDSRDRDKFLSDFWRKEPHLAGVIYQVTAIDGNREWSLIGGRNQVARYNRILRAVEAGAGWRVFMRKAAESFYTTDMGAVVEIGRDGEDGPMRSLFHVDPTRCRLTGDLYEPLEYTPNNFKGQIWTPNDYFRVASMPSIREEFHGLGFCAVSRAYELAATLLAVYEHDQEKLGARAPKGLLLLQNISEDQWSQAMATRDAALNARNQDYYAGVTVLATMGLDVPDAKLIALSQLPDGFDLETVTDLYMYGLALILGYDPSEFWVVNAGALGRGRETEVQHRKSITKGAHDFTLGLQDQLQQLLPEALLFEFEQRDATGELLEAQVQTAWAEVAAKISPFLSQDEARQWLAERGIIPSEWTEAEEEAEALASGQLRSLKQRLVDDLSVRRAAQEFPNEPIVQFTWRANGRYSTRPLWRRGSDLLVPEQVYWQGYDYVPTDSLLHRATPGEVGQALDDADPPNVLWEDDESDETITFADVQEAILEGIRRDTADGLLGDMLVAEVTGE